VALYKEWCVENGEAFKPVLAEDLRVLGVKDSPYAYRVELQGISYEGTVLCQLTVFECCMVSLNNSSVSQQIFGLLVRPTIWNKCPY
jgi:hypothetical protein